MQDEFVNRIMKSSPILPATAGLIQKQLGLKLEVSRQTIEGIIDPQQTK